MLSPAGCAVKAALHLLLPIMMHKTLSMGIAQSWVGAGVAEEAVLLHWPSLALQAGQEEQALEAAASACQALPNSSAAWQQRLSLQARHATLQVCINCRTCCTMLSCTALSYAESVADMAAALKATVQTPLRRNCIVKTGSPYVNQAT